MAGGYLRAVGVPEGVVEQIRLAAMEWVELMEGDGLVLEISNGSFVEANHRKSEAEHLVVLGKPDGLLWVGSSRS